MNHSATLQPTICTRGVALALHSPQGQAKKPPYWIPCPVLDTCIGCYINTGILNPRPRLQAALAHYSTAINSLAHPIEIFHSPLPLCSTFQMPKSNKPMALQTLALILPSQKQRPIPTAPCPSLFLNKVPLIPLLPRDIEFVQHFSSKSAGSVVEFILCDTRDGPCN